MGFLRRELVWGMRSPRAERKIGLGTELSSNEYGLLSSNVLIPPWGKLGCDEQMGELALCTYVNKASDDIGGRVKAYSE